MMSTEEFAFPRPHSFTFFLGTVIPTENVQDSVGHQERQFVIEGTGVQRRLPRSDRWTDHDVTEEQRQVPSIHGAAIRPLRATRRTGDDFDDFAAVDGERQHVGRTCFTHVLAIEFGHVRFVDEKDAQLGSSTNSFGAKDRHREPLPPFDVDRDLDLFVGTEDLRIGVTSDLGSSGESWRARIHECSPASGLGARS